MKIGLLSAVSIITLAFTGAAQAGTITETLAVTITGGYTTTANPFVEINAPNDTLDLFGGGNLSGAKMTLTFSYDIDALNADVADSNAIYEDGQINYYTDDYAGDSDISLRLSINGFTYATTNSTDEIEAFLYSNPAVGGQNLFLDVQGYYTNQVLNMSFESTDPVPLGQLANPTALAGVSHPNSAILP